MYDLQQLGWYGFQQLCNSILREVLGQTAVTFLASHDGGRDGSYTGIWTNKEGIVYEGKFVLQCKYTSLRDYNLKISDLSIELPKVKNLVDDNLCDIYILMTNAGLSGNIEKNIKKELSKIGVKNVLVFGSTWIHDQIKEHSRLRRLVPRVYGLGDLSQILDERVYTQGRVLLESLKDDLAKVVVTSAYNKAAEALEEYGFVLLIGEPAAGKTTIASLLAMGALDQWKAMTLKLNTADQVIKHWNPEEPGQFFWIDDVFGVTQYESNLSYSWNHVWPNLKAMLKSGARIVMTSRDYIYNAARNDLKEGAFPLLSESKVVIDVHDLSLTEKRQILYNHIKMGRQPIEFKSQIKEYLEGIANLNRFIPETARRLADPFFTKNLYIDEYYLEEFVNKQEGFLIEVLRGLDKDSKAGLALIYMNSNNLSSPLNPNSDETKAMIRLGSSLNGCILALDAMKGNLVQSINIGGEFIWQFKHPTIGDAFASFIVSTPDMIEIYLRGSSLDKLLNQITCGDVGISKAIVIPKAFFSLILKRLKNFDKSQEYKSSYLARWGAQRKLHDFLSFRSSVDFLKLYIKENPELLDSISNPNLYLESSSEVNLASVLFRSKLLPEENRRIFITNVSQYALKGEDLFALKSDKILEMFTEDELTNLKYEIRKELFPIIPDLKEKFISSYIEGDPEDHVYRLKYNLRILKKTFASIEDEINQEEEDINNWIEFNTEEEKILPERESLSSFDSSNELEGERSIFDDIDS